MTKQELAQIIVLQIFKELRGRRGFRHLLEEIELEDAETWAELQQVLINIVESNLKEI